VPHPDVVNTTRRALQVLHLQDEAARPVAVVVLRETWAITPRGLAPLEAEPPIDVAGALHPPLPPPSTPASGAARPAGPPSARLEPEATFVKPSTDVLLLGTAVASEPRGRTGQVRLRLGPIDKSVLVFGVRTWSRGVAEPALTAPLPLEPTSLRWEHAFGGPEERRNPIGVGHFGRTPVFVDGAAAPRLERPDAPIRGWRDTPAPAGFGVVSGGWLPRAALAGTYDEAWQATRMPALPSDFDRRYFQSAPLDQITPRPLAGGEAFLVEGVQIGDDPGPGALRGALPRGAWPTLELTLRDRVEAPRPTLDTVVLDADAATLSLTWRAHAVLPRGAHDLRAVRVGEG
jgi:hypothetical protein